MVALTAICSSLLWANAAGGAARDFSPQAVFALPDHAVIDDRCGDARAFSKRAAMSLDDVDEAAAVAAANAFIGCYQLARLNPDEDAQRYLFLAAATFLYLAATRSKGEPALSFYRRADGMARQLGARGTNIDVIIEHVQVGRTLSNPVPANPGKEEYVVNHNPLGTVPPGKFTDVANRMLVAIARALASGDVPVPSGTR